MMLVRSLVSGALVGCAVWCSWAVMETVVLAGSRNSLRWGHDGPWIWHRLIEGYLVNCLGGLALGTLVGLAVWIAREPLALARVRAMPAQLAGCIASVLFIVGGWQVNHVLLPSATSPASLVFDVAWLVACVLATVVLYRVTAALGERWLRVRVIRCGAASALAAVVSVLFVPLLAGGGSAPVVRRAEGPPNVLVVVLDTVRADHVSANGYGRPTTPNLERLAADGLRFSRAYSTAPWTLPAHASIFTGCYQNSHGATAESLSLPTGTETLAELFRDAGYQTFGISSNPWVSRNTGLDRGFAAYQGTWAPPRQWTLKTIAERLIYGWRVDPAVRAVEYFESLVRDGLRQGGRFFAFVNLINAHSEFRPPDGFARRFGVAPAEIESAERLNQLKYGVWAGAIDSESVDWELQTALYDAEIAYVDETLGRIEHALRRAGLWDNTVVVVTADHGEHLGDAGWIDHRFSLADSLLHVPLVVRGPGVQGAGSVIDAPVSLVDIFPTLSRLAGVSDGAPGDCPGTGIDLLAARGDPGVLRARPVLAEEFVADDLIAEIESRYPQIDVGRFRQRVSALRIDEWKYVLGYGGHEALYETGSDPGETTNLASVEPARRARMREQLEATVASARRSLAVAAAPTLDKRTRAALSALGYVN